MSTTPTTLTQMNPVISAIDTQVLNYAPAVLAGVQAAEMTAASGPSKFQAVLAGILAGSQAAEAIPIPNVQGIAALVNLSVTILNMLGAFSHKPKPVAPATP